MARAPLTFHCVRLAPLQASGFQLRGGSRPGADPQSPPEALLGRMVRAPDGGGAVSASALRPGVDVKWSRALGMLLCHCGVARRLALKLHGRRKAAAREFGNSKLAAERETL